MILIATSLLDDLRLYDDGSAALIETHGEIERRNGGRAADNEDFGQRSAIDLVAGRTGLGAPSHSIIKSALPSSVAGNSMPSDFAVLRFRASS